MPHTKKNPTRIPEWSPIILTVYNRPEHFKTCVSSLLTNDGASETVLYISSDGPRSETDQAAVSEVREIIANISGFKDVVVFAPEENTNGRIQADVVAAVAAKHPAYLFAEDDIFFSTDFLTFVNAGLRAFAEHKEILAVCGYLYPDFPSTDASQLYLKCFTAWGYGTWSDRPAFYENQLEVAQRVLSTTELFREANRTLPHTIRLSREVLRGSLVADDITASNRLFIENKYCIFPPATLVKNMGFDGTGAHCREDLTYARQKLATRAVHMDAHKPVVENKRGQKFLFTIFGGPVFWILNHGIHWEHTVRDPGAKRFLTTTNDVLWKTVLGLYSWLRGVQNSIGKRSRRS